MTSDKLQRDIRLDVETMYDNYYPLCKSKDIAFEIGRLFMSMKDYKTAMVYFLDSLRHCGDHHVTHYNLGLCHNYVGECDSALECFERSLSLCSDYHEARDWLTRIKSLLQRP